MNDIEQLDPTLQTTEWETLFSTMLKLFTGHSLGDDDDLGEAMKNIKTARNRFVHDGAPRISKNAPVLTKDETLKLSVKMNAIAGGYAILQQTSFCRTHQVASLSPPQTIN